MPDSESSSAARREESWASTPGTRASMQSNRGRDTTPELAVRRRLHAMGLRYRVSVRPVPNLRRTADIVFTRARIAVFIDGCFWHGCPDHYVIPKTNVHYWSPKIETNLARDADTSAQLREAGWTVLRFWEHEPATDVAERVMAAVGDSAATPHEREASA